MRNYMFPSMQWEPCLTTVNVKGFNALPHDHVSAPNIGKKLTGSERICPALEVCLDLRDMPPALQSKKKPFIKRGSMSKILAKRG